MEPSSVRSKVSGVLSIVVPLGLSTKGIAFLLCSTIGESLVCCMKSVFFKKLLLNLPLILRINEVVCSSKFNDQSGGTFFPADILFNRE